MIDVDTFYFGDYGEVLNRGLWGEINIYIKT